MVSILKNWPKKKTNVGRESREGTIELIVPAAICERMGVKPGDKLLMAYADEGAVFYRVDLTSLVDREKIAILRQFMGEIKTGRKPKNYAGVGTLPGMEHAA